MGVTGLWKLIEQSGKPVPLDTLENKVLAVDISIWLHQVVKGFQDSNGATLPHAHLLGLFHRLCKLMYYRIKPVFVFDGGVPALKRDTIARRARNKNKYQSEADKLQQLLLESLAKEKVVQQALGPSTSALLVSPKKAIQKQQKDKDDEDDLFKLPPMEQELEKEPDESLTDLSENDSSFDATARVKYNQSLQQIDVKSSYFQSLPADIRHEILSDIKETRKQSSWGRLHELPAESQSFSTFQMGRLLKRRQVQVELEEAEKEMGGKGLSMAELENLLSEEGVVDPDLATERIASNENVRFLHVRDITKAMTKEANDKIKKEEKAVKVEIQSPLKSCKLEPIIEEDLDLQRAIQLSLGSEVPELDNEEESGLQCSGESVKLTVQQRKALGTAAGSLARNFMLEYGGMNDEQIADLVKLDESFVQSTSEFKYNDESILIGKNEDESAQSTVKIATSETSEAKTTETKIPKIVDDRDLKLSTIDLSDASSEGEKYISSDGDSDFVDVSDVEGDVDNEFFVQSQMSLPPPFLMNSPVKPSTSNDFRLQDLALKSNKIEVVINPGKICDVDNDIFADVFNAGESKAEKTKPVETENWPIENVATKIEVVINPTDVRATKDDIFADIFNPIESVVKIDTEQTKTVESTGTNSADQLPIVPKAIPVGDDKMKNILNDLNSEIDTVKMLSLDDLLKPKPSTQGSPAKSREAINGTTTPPPKIPQPFFVKKTPPSSKKKSPGKAAETNVASPSKASKSLLDAFEQLPVKPSTSFQEETVAMAAEVLRENKSETELKEIQQQLNQDRIDLLAERNKKDRLGVTITERMSMECMELLRLFGVPYIVAPMEAEAQCAYLNEIELTDGTITDDSDIWLFGGKTVYKNFFDQNKLVMEFKSSNISKVFHLTRRELIQLSFLVGSDYTQGIHGIGAVTALEILSVFTPTPEKEGETTQIMSILSSLRKFREWWSHKNVTQRTMALRSKLKNITIGEDFPNPNVVEAYLFPTVDENRERFAWGRLEVESIREYTKKTFGWTKQRTDEIILPVMKRLDEKVSQQSIQNYFKIVDVTSRKDIKVSKRVRLALDKMSADPQSGDSKDESETVAPAETKKKVKRKTAKKSTEDKAVEGSIDVSTLQTADEAKVKTKDKPKPRRKRKAVATKSADDDDIMDVFDVPSTSSGIGKKVALPDPNRPIPQREKDKEIMESNKLKAIELMKKLKKDKKT